MTGNRADEQATDEARPRRRQARGERRIATAAGISPGSLYQFFPNKVAIAQALADRFVAQMRAAHADAFDSTDFSKISLDELLDRVVDPILAFNLSNPGFKAIFARPDMPEAEAIEFLLRQMAKSKNNKEFFTQMAQG